MKNKARYEVFMKRSFFMKKQWYWRLKAPNNEIIAIGTEPFDSYDNVLRAIDAVKKYVSTSDVVQM